MVNINYYIRELTSTKETFVTLLKDVEPYQVNWRQNREKWNLLEIICHLYDEEREDFRARLKLLLDSPGVPFPKIDPVSWVNERSYANQKVDSMIRKFSDERIKSIKWLQSLQSANWENYYMHPWVGKIRAGFILANWLAHDYLHIRQIIRLKYDYLRYVSGEGLDYAGNW